MNNTIPTQRRPDIGRDISFIWCLAYLRLDIYQQQAIKLISHCVDIVRPFRLTSDQLDVGEIDQHEITINPGLKTYLVNFSHGGWDDNYPKVGWNHNDPLLIVLGVREVLVDTDIDSEVYQYQISPQLHCLMTGLTNTTNWITLFTPLIKWIYMVEP